MHNNQLMNYNAIYNAHIMLSAILTMSYNLCSISIRSCQPKTHTLECVLVQVGVWSLHVFVHLHNVSMCNSKHSIGININTQLFIPFKQGRVIRNTHALITTKLLTHLCEIHAKSTYARPLPTN